jgi:hypothetical protein
LNVKKKRKQVKWKEGQSGNWNGWKQLRKKKNQEVWSQKIGQVENWAVPRHLLPHFQSSRLWGMWTGIRGWLGPVRKLSGGMRAVPIGKEVAVPVWLLLAHSSPPRCQRVRIWKFVKHYCKQYIRFLSILLPDIRS